MTIKEAYDSIGADYESTLTRMAGMEHMISKFAIRFLSDKSYGALEESMKGNDAQMAFRMAHTMKGLCQNLGFTRLGEASSRLTEELRNGKGANADSLFSEVAKEYEKTINAIKNI